MSKRKAYLYATIGLICALLGTYIVYALTFPATIPTSGTYTGTIIVTLNPISIDWGPVTLANPVTKNVEITNIGTQHIKNLNMTTSPQVGLTSSDYTLTWNLEGSPLNVADSKIASFTLTIIKTVASSFSFDIIVDEA